MVLEIEREKYMKSNSFIVTEGGKFSEVDTVDWLH